MKILVINGSYRKGKTIDTLVQSAIKGIKSSNENVSVDEIHLTDFNIKYCTNCMVCRNDDPSKEIARCTISDDMQKIYPMINEADCFIFSTPINCGTVTAIMKTFLERTCWTFARPGKFPIKGCPEPRTTRKKLAIILLSTGIIPPLFRKFCDDGTIKI